MKLKCRIQSTRKSAIWQGGMRLVPGDNQFEMEPAALQDAIVTFQDDEHLTLVVDETEQALIDAGVIPAGEADEADEADETDETDDGDPGVDLDGLTVPELRVLCKERGIAHKGLKKAELIAAL